MVAKKRKGIVKRGLRRGEQGINPLLVALGAGAGAAGGAGIGVGRAVSTSRRIPAAAGRISEVASRKFEQNMKNADYARRATASERSGLYTLRNSDDASRGEINRARSEANRQAYNMDEQTAKANSIRSSGKMNPASVKNTIKRKLVSAPKVATNRTKRLAGKGAIKGGVLAALAQAVLAEMNKKKRD